MTWPVLVFDIESIPDVAGLRAMRSDPADATDEQVFAAWAQERKDKGQSDFMPLHLQRILVISCVFRNAEGLRVHSFVDRDGASEGKVIQTFFNTIEKHVPQLVSWNGGGFDLPVLNYRGLKHGVVADKAWDRWAYGNCPGAGGAGSDPGRDATITQDGAWRGDGVRESSRQPARPLALFVAMFVQ